ncbi:MAG: VanZ family protein [Spirochaetes bacterium]|nr:VanZ family protein [Spirochaetota bacterium]
MSLITRLLQYKIFLICINLVLLAFILFFGFQPFAFNPENKVSRLRNSHGVSTHDSVLIYETDEEKDGGLLNNLSPMTIETAVIPFQEKQARLSAILCFYDEREPELLMVAKWKSELILRRRIKRPHGSYAYHEIGIPNAFIINKTSFITITTGICGTTIYINGKKAGVFPRYILDSRSENNLKTRIMLGNDPQLKTPWNGEIRGLAIYGSALTAGDISSHVNRWSEQDFISLSKESGIIALYPMNEKSGPYLNNVLTRKNNLYIPNNLFTIKKTVLRCPRDYFTRTHHFCPDLVLNVIGFIPLGFFLLALLVSLFGKSNNQLVIITIICGSAISLTIELIQAFMPLRSSDLMDLFSNTVGTIIGVVLFRVIYCKYCKKIKGGLL